MRAVIGAPKKSRMPSNAEERARGVADRDEAGDDVLLGVIHEDIAHAEGERAEEREPGVLLQREGHRQPPADAPAEEDERGGEEAVGDAHLRGHRAELVGDGEPGRAPDRHAAGKELEVRHAAHFYIPETRARNCGYVGALTYAP